MNSVLSGGTLSRFAELLTRRFGLHFPDNRADELSRSLVAVAKELGFSDVDECVAQFESTPLSETQVEALTSRFTVPESYFFRQRRALSLFEERIVPELAKRGERFGKRMRIWSAGCSTGEEAYSFAIMARRLLPGWSDWNVTILGTDINPKSLARAKAGIYREWSFRGAPDWLKTRYFRSIDEQGYELIPEVKAKVSFAYHNLAVDPFPSVTNNTNAMDLILCCNVLMYFDPKLIGGIVDRFYDCLVEGGWLIVDATEVALIEPRRFKVVTISGATFFRRLELSEAAPVPAEPLPEIKVAPRIEAKKAALPKRKKPDLARERYPFASRLFEQGRYQEALLLLDSVAGAAADALRARIHANLGQLPAALGWCEQAVLHDKLNPDYHYLYALILEELGRPDEAVAALNRTLYLEPDYVLAHVGLGNLTEKNGQKKLAARHFAHALQLLKRFAAEDALPGAEGMTAGRMAEHVAAKLRMLQ